MSGEPVFSNEFSGGTAETVLQVGHADLVNVYGANAAAPPRRALAGLPARPGPLVGREAPTRSLLGLLGPDRPDPSSTGPRGVVVTGQGGVGKTSLALDAAHQALERGWFPGGVLYADAGTLPPGRPPGPEELLSAFLRMLGVPGGELPPHRIGLEAMFRSQLKTHGDQYGAVLVLLDNAADETQFTPLLPADPRHRLLVTSRTRPGTRDMAVLPLHVLTARDSRALLSAAHDPGENEELDELAALCGHLPLALGVVRARLDREEHDAAPLLSALRPQRDRLGELGLDATFDLSYRKFDEPTARLLRMLGLHPGPLLDAASASALSGLSPARTRRALDRLRDAHLLLPGDASGQYRFHDLTRLYAQARLADESDGARSEALGRLLDHYADEAGAADPGPWFEHHAAAAAKAVGMAVAADAHERVAAIGDPLLEFLTKRAQLVESLHLLTDLVDSAQRERKFARQIELLGKMASRYGDLSCWEHQMTCFEAANLVNVRHPVRVRDRHDVNADVAAMNGDLTAAIRRRRKAVSHWRWDGDTGREVDSRIALGDHLTEAHDPDRARRAYRDAADLAESATDPVRAARAHRRLAKDAGDRGEWAAARSHGVTAQEFAVRSGDVRATVTAVRARADTELLASAPRAAAPLLGDALELARAHQLRGEETNCQLALVRLHLASGERALASELLDFIRPLIEAREARDAPPGVPPPPPLPSQPLTRRDRARTLAGPAAGVLWATGCLVAGAAVDGSGPAALWGAHLGLTVVGAWAARRYWHHGIAPGKLNSLAVASQLVVPMLAMGVLWAIALATSQPEATAVMTVTAACLLLIQMALIWSGPRPLMKRPYKWVRSRLHTAR
ncbi:Regulatory protein AfsR [Streptomyces sp. S4.7]|uniref:hypothetical protein n=1 Tax=Streptomyces sp. S4.7 TaxID=2705439 RepID=UPI0013991731|nr:hypothetical protein [Streptomyces sp. S4.7]QHY99271.1 Regulatory protein AfsR [Streptomyces sp. S4.7]